MDWLPVFYRVRFQRSKKESLSLSLSIYIYILHTNKYININEYFIITMLYSKLFIILFLPIHFMK